VEFEGYLDQVTTETEKAGIAMGNRRGGKLAYWGSPLMFKSAGVEQYTNTVYQRGDDPPKFTDDVYVEGPDGEVRVGGQEEPDEVDVSDAPDATERLRDGQVVSIDGEMGVVEVGTDGEPEQTTADESADSARTDAGDTTDGGPQLDQHSPVKPMTGTEVKVNISIPEAAERAAATGADGVGLLRLEHMVTSTDKTPSRYVEDHGERAYVEEIVEGVRQVAEGFYPRPVRVRTLDAPSDEFRQLQGGEDEPTEHNPMLGYRGIRRSLDRPEEFDLDLRAFARLYELGYDNVELMLPLVTDAEDVLRAKSRIEAAGIDPEKRDWGVMVETPASALSIEAICGTGIDFVSFGTNDLTQYTLAVDRNNTRVADRFDELHPAVLDLVAGVIETCRANDVATSICGQAASKPEMVQFLVDEGVTSISANIDAVRDVQHEVKRVEQRLLLDSVR
jgi:pyruvate,water dikinase